MGGPDPQIFRPGLLREGFSLAREQHLDVTDDASLVEALRKKVALVMAPMTTGRSPRRKIWTGPRIWQHAGRERTWNFESAPAMMSIVWWKAVP